MNDNTTINDDISQGLNAFVQGNYEQSIRHFSAALSGDPDHRMSLLIRGSAFLKSNRLNEAVTDFDRVIALFPDDVRAYHLRGVAKATRGDDLEALRDFDKAIELDAAYGAAYASRGTVHQRLGHQDLAVEDMTMVTHLTQVNLEAFNTGNNVWQTRHMRVEDAMETELNR